MQRTAAHSSELGSALDPECTFHPNAGVDGTGVGGLYRTRAHLEEVSEALYKDAHNRRLRRQMIVEQVGARPLPRYLPPWLSPYLPTSLPTYLLRARPYTPCSPTIRPSVSLPLPTLLSLLARSLPTTLCGSADGCGDVGAS